MLVLQEVPVILRKSQFRLAQWFRTVGIRRQPLKRKQLHDSTHLTLEERKVIQTGIENNSTKADIARTISKDATTVAKEIRKHRKSKQRNTYNRPILCAKRKDCPRKPCMPTCELFEEPSCSRRDKSPGACNGCAKTSKCLYDKFFDTVLPLLMRNTVGTLWIIVRVSI